MVKLWGMALGGYPRNRVIRYALRDLERGDISATEYHEVWVKVHAEIIGVQKSQGFPVVVDGMIDWHDIFRPFIRSWRNTSINGLLRFFDNNFFYRIPVFHGEPDIIEPVWSRRVREFHRIAEPASLKIVLPGPYTMSVMAKNESPLEAGELMERISYLLRREVEKTAEYNVYIQVDEPILSSREIGSDDTQQAIEAVNKIIDGFEEKSILAVYFDAPNREVMETLLETKAKYLSIDYMDTPHRASEALKSVSFADHSLVLGLVDARRIHRDTLKDNVKQLLKELAQEVDEIVVSTTTWMDLIPYRYALKKTRILGDLVDEVAELLGVEPIRLWG
jgi:5-methyltetrahydropteroyltriglutamate--homocysteine methyltransferase